MRVFVAIGHPICATIGSLPTYCSSAHRHPKTNFPAHPFAFPCRRRHLSSGASLAVKLACTSRRGQMCHSTVCSVDSGKEPEDGFPVLQPITEGARADNVQTCKHAHARSSSHSRSVSAPKFVSASVCNAIAERSAISPEMRADMLQFLRENPDMRPKSRRTWEIFKEKTCCERSADSLKTHAATKVFRMEQSGQKVALLERPQRMKIKKDLWQR